MQCLSQNGNDQQRHCTADQGGNQLGPAEGGGQCFQHGFFHHAGSQQIFGQDSADQPYHDCVECSEFGNGGGKPGDDLAMDMLSVLVCHEIDLINRLSALAKNLYASIDKLESDTLSTSKGNNSLEIARFYREKVFFDMKALRDDCDKLENLVDKNDWPFPTYADLLYSIK